MLLPILAVLIALATGIDRTWDANLATLAQQRSAEVAVTRSHRDMPELAGYNWGEVIAWNNADDPAPFAISQWQGSPSHWSILTGSQYHYMACAETVTDYHYIVCLFTDRAFAPGTVGPPIGESIPDTAMESSVNLPLFLGGFLIGLAVGWLRSSRTVQPTFDYRHPQTWGVTQNSATGNFTFADGLRASDAAAKAWAEGLKSRVFQDLEIRRRPQ